jgi:hypothetical protein
MVEIGEIETTMAELMPRITNWSGPNEKCVLPARLFEGMKLAILSREEGEEMEVIREGIKRSRQQVSAKQNWLTKSWSKTVAEMTQASKGEFIAKALVHLEQLRQTTVRADRSGLVAIALEAEFLKTARAILYAEGEVEQWTSAEAYKLGLTERGLEARDIALQTRGMEINPLKEKKIKMLLNLPATAVLPPDNIVGVRWAGLEKEIKNNSAEDFAFAVRIAWWRTGHVGKAGAESPDSPSVCAER